jgi:predicted alpha-1,2-mannosidase
LIALHGGKEPFVRKLDSLFTASSQLTGENVSADISGLIGQYAHGNEPSHHIAYLYNFAGEHAKTQQRVRQICTELYTNQPDGLSGNEDCGQMSAWYVFSAMGFYPVNPASAVYEIGSPLFSKVTIRLPNGKVFTIRADQQAADHPYIQQATWNGKPLAISSLTHEQILAGGELVLQMGAAPSKLWQ